MPLRIGLQYAPNAGIRIMSEAQLAVSDEIRDDFSLTLGVLFPFGAMPTLIGALVGAAGPLVPVLAQTAGILGTLPAARWPWCARGRARPRT